MCGREGILTGKFFETDEDRAFFSVVPLVNTTREEALKRAAYHGSDTWGVVPLKNGSWGVRVLSEMYEEAVKKIRPDDHATILGPVYEIGGCPESMGDEGLVEFLGEANPVLEIKGSRRYGWGTGTRKKFFVKTTIPISWGLKQGDTFLATCNLAKEHTTKPPTVRAEVYQFRPTRAAGYPRLGAEQPPKPLSLSSDVIMSTPANDRNVRARQDPPPLQTNLTAGVTAPNIGGGAHVSDATAPTDMMAALQALLAPLNTELQGMHSDIAPLL